MWRTVEPHRFADFPGGVWGCRAKIPECWEALALKGVGPSEDVGFRVQG